jgi:hypothetical protein
MSRGRPFEPGNTFGKGRPKGSKNKGTPAGRRLLEEHEESLMRKAIAEGMKGNMKALLWCLTELSRRMPRAAKLKLLPIKTHEDVAKAFDVILAAVANQKRTVAEGQALSAMLAEKGRMIETQDLPSLEELERRTKKDGSK